VSNEAVVKPAVTRAGRQRLGHTQTEFGSLLNPSSPPSLGGSEERKRPKDFRRIIGCAARRRLLEVDTLARLERVALDLGAVRTTETRDAARARSGGFEYDPLEAGQFFEIAAVQSRALGLSGWRWPPLVAMVNEAFERVTAARLRSRSRACSRGLTGRGHCRASSLRRRQRRWL
jgi:hypothetical protein